MPAKTFRKFGAGANHLGLTPEQIERLRRAFPYGEDESWVIRVAEEYGWEEANHRYLAWHRERGRFEMAALMGELGLTQVSHPGQAAELVALAYDLFMPIEAFRGKIERLAENKFRIVVDVCPTYEKVEKAGWHGVTACSCWHHRQGWYDVMEIQVVDSLMAEKKWGDTACVAEIEFTIPKEEQ